MSLTKDQLQEAADAFATHYRLPEGVIGYRYLDISDRPKLTMDSDPSVFMFPPSFFLSVHANEVGNVSELYDLLVQKQNRCLYSFINHPSKSRVYFADFGNWKLELDHSGEEPIYCLAKRITITSTRDAYHFE